MSDANVDDELYKFLVHKRPYRRVRASEGKSWIPDQTNLDFRDSGLMCTRTCHKRIHYKDLTIVYERRHNDIIRMWVCLCDDVIKEDNMTDLAIVYETRKGNLGL